MSKINIILSFPQTGKNSLQKFQVADNVFLRCLASQSLPMGSKKVEKTNFLRTWQARNFMYIGINYAWKCARHLVHQREMLLLCSYISMVTDFTFLKYHLNSRILGIKIQGLIYWMIEAFQTGKLFFYLYLPICLELLLCA